MQIYDWIPIYKEIAEDMGYSQGSDGSAADLLKRETAGSDRIDDVCLGDIIKGDVTVTGGSAFSISDIPDGVIMAAGSSIPALLDSGIIPDIIVTDLDGNIEAQKEASANGSVTIMHAHGDNVNEIMKHAKDFQGRIMLTAQSIPSTGIYNFGGFTDGDRAVCTAAHFAARRIYLAGFDLDNPSPKDGTDMETKRRKLNWAKRIISKVSETADIRFI